MANSTKIVLEAAGRWSCPYCEREDNYVPFLIKEFSEGEAGEYAKEFGMEPHEMHTGDFVVIPNEVCCEQCKEIYEVSGLWMQDRG